MLVFHDLLGLTNGYVPRFVKQYANIGETISKAVAQFGEEVRSGEFPGTKQSYK